MLYIVITDDFLPRPSNLIFYSPLYSPYHEMISKLPWIAFDLNTNVISSSNNLLERFRMGDDAFFSHNLFASIALYGKSSVMYVLGPRFAAFKLALQCLTGDVRYWEMFRVTSLKYLFCFANVNVDISGWDVSSVTDMTGTFRNSQFNQNINAWNVSKVRSFKFMFSENEEFNQPIDKWKMQIGSDIRGMFTNAKRFDHRIPSILQHSALKEKIDRRVDWTHFTIYVTMSVVSSVYSRYYFIAGRISMWSRSFFYWILFSLVITGLCFELAKQLAVLLTS